MTRFQLCSWQLPELSNGNGFQKVVLTVALMLQCCVRLSVVCDVMYCSQTVRPRTEVIIDIL